MIGFPNLKVFIYDPDVYGRYAINSYLAWDRRTRVMGMFATTGQMFEWLADHAEAEWPDILLLDTYTHHTPDLLRTLVQRLLQAIGDDLKIIVLDREPDAQLAQAALEAGATAYFLRNDVGLQVAWAIVWVHEESHRYSISSGLSDVLEHHLYPDLSNAAVLPRQRHYPELTERIREAIQLCVVEGMRADLAADEMGVSTHTIRSYVKEGYRILESYDVDVEYPSEMSAQERAFMRFTALEEGDLDVADLELPDSDTHDEDESE